MASQCGRNSPIPSETAQPGQASSQDEAERRLAFLEDVFNLLPIGVIVSAGDGTNLLVNQTARLQARSFGDASPNGTPSAGPSSRDQQMLGNAITPGTAFTVEEHVVPGEHERTFLNSHRRIRVLDEDLVLSTSLDITDQKQVESDLLRRAYFDDLTELPNRNLIQEQVAALIDEEGGSNCFALAFLDIDNFKHINDYHTQTVGDRLLQLVARRIATHMRSMDTLARTGGSEFLLLITSLQRPDEITTIIDPLLLHMNEGFFVDGFEIFTSASVGISLFPHHGRNFEDLRRHANSAIEQAKGNVKGGAAIFDTDIGRAMSARMAQEQRLRSALRDGQFCCAFQPKVDIRSQEVVGVEALIRLRDKHGLMEPPGNFIGLAAELGLIDDITRLMVAEIVKSVDAIDDAFGKDVSISVNVAAKQAVDLTFMRSLCADFEATCSPQRFIVEVTEDAFIDKNKFQADIVPMLRHLGVRISIDDFGTGYSSLSALSEITADEIKIDRSFITDIHCRPRSQRVLRAIEVLGKALGMDVMVEGVETAEELAYLQAETSIIYAQGYYFAKPMLIEEIANPSRTRGRARTYSARACGGSSSSANRWPTARATRARSR